MKPRICAAITSKDLKAINEVEPLVDLFELRIDLVGVDWPDLATELKKPWIACVRSKAEGGNWPGDDAEKIEELITAAELGADMVDIELGTTNLAEVIPLIKRRAKCLLSLHELEKTPPLEQLKEIVKKQLAVGADICKVVTTAQSPADNLTTLRLITEFPKVKMVSFAMGPLGLASRVLCPLVGGYFTYASLAEGKESAPGQLTADQLKGIYRMMIR
jgi:3-dehydroquinate dehydratase type I